MHFHLICLKLLQNLQACQALGSRDRPAYASGYVASLLSGLSKVFLSIQRRHYEQVKVAIPVILNVLQATTSELDDEDNECINLFSRALGIADSVQTVCAKLEGIVKEKLCALLALYVLQIMALLSLKEGGENSSYLHLVSQLSMFFSYCGLSYLGLITGSDIDMKMNIVVEENDDDCRSCLPYIKHGASLSVIWGHIDEDVSQAARENMSAVKAELQNKQTNRWQAVGMLKHILASTTMPWELKKHAINFLLCITTGSGTQSDERTDCSIYLPSLCATLQAITMVIIYAPNTELRKNAFEALKRVLADIPSTERFDILKTLVTNSDSSSMIAILLDLVRGELHMENRQKTLLRKDEDLQPESQRSSVASLWTAGVLELVEFVLRPPEGGPPRFPENGDAVLAALNLYRFILITESAGKTNFTGALSRNNLQQAYSQWFLPLRSVVTGILAENKNDHDQFAINTVCALNPVELVLYRCIELVEEKLKHSR
ncbi:aberrant root formation protein 4 isoform X2 [Ricinus communis]|uniref:aberrant root formation protein 4 isoform X2 n=1 Tax=Ricinus communis TaxID=3988 RepID=UPI00201AA331|nr:aberrant root formation protein 4 isoform X2 [Ricinus communis]